MKLFLCKKVSKVWTAGLLCLTFLPVTVANASLKQPTSTIIQQTDRLSDRRQPVASAFDQIILTQDCVSCAPQIAPGAPLSGNKSASYISQVASISLNREDADFYSQLYMYCNVLGNLDDGERAFKKGLIEPMLKTASDKKIDRYWTDVGCEPRFVGDTLSPLIHKIAENATDRMQFLVFLKKYYEERGDRATFRKVINAKNTSGQTVLDYITYVHGNNKFIKVEERGLNEFVKYLCDNGAVYSKYNKSCPAEYITI